LFQNFASLPGFPADSYMDYFLPGVLIMTVLFGSSWAGVSLLREITAGTVDKMLVSPVSRSAIVLSRVLHAAVQVVVQVLIVMITAAILGANIHWSPANVAVALLVVFLMGIGFAAVSNGLAMILQREEPLVVMGNMLTLPLMFFSTALVPEDFMPSWIQYIALINPVEYAVSAVRAVLIGTVDWQASGIGLGVTFLFALATSLWAVSAFKANQS
jgi:ABC-2 type transport system permease protein